MKTKERKFKNSPKQTRNKHKHTHTHTHAVLTTTPILAMGGNNKRVKVVSPLPFDADGGGGEKNVSSSLSYLKSLQNLIRCDGCQNAMWLDDEQSPPPITLHCGHTICRNCGMKATEPRKGFYEAFCPAQSGCSEQVFARDFTDAVVGNIKMVEIAHRARELETKMLKEKRRREDAFCAGEDAKEVRAVARKLGEKDEKNNNGIESAAMMVARAVPTRKLTEAFESALLRTACESAMEIMGDPDVPPGMASFVDGSREKEGEKFAKLEARRKVIMASASEREKAEAMEELSRTIEELKEKRAKIRRAREMLEERERVEEEEKGPSSSQEDLAVLREKVTREIDAMNTNQLRARYVHMHGKQPVKGTTKSDYRKIFENVDPSVWLATTKYLEASRNNRSQPSQDHQLQQEGVLLVRDSLGVDEEATMRKGAMGTAKATTTATKELFHNPFSRLRSSTRINNKRRASESFDIPEVFALTNTSSETEQSVKDAAYDEILNQITRCGRHAVVVKDDDEPLGDDVTHCIVTSGATIHSNDDDGKTKNGARKKYVIKKRSVRYLESLARGIWIVSSEWLDSRKDLKKYANEEEFEIHDAAGTWNMGTNGLLDVRIFDSTSLHRKKKEIFSGLFESSESDSLMLTRRARTTKEIAAAKSSGIFNGLKIVVDVPDFFFASSKKTEWSICKSDCERILESAGAEVLRERDYVVLDSYFGENETDSPVPDSEDDEQDEQNIKQQQQQQRSKGEWKFKEEACASVDFVLLDGDAQPELQRIKRAKQTFPSAKVVDWHWFVDSLVKGYTLETEDTYEMPLGVRYPRQNFRL